MTASSHRGASSGQRPPIERASSTDRAFLAMDTGEVPQQFGVVLLLDGGLDLARARQLFAERIPAVPRLRQRLVRVPFGCGGPIWIDDSAFDIRDHVQAVTCPAPGDEAALLDVALAVIATPLPRVAPLWSAAVIGGLADGRTALVVVLHHVLADGIGGLAVLSCLVDQGIGAAERLFPQPRPNRARLVRDALLRRARALRRARRAWRLLRESLSAGGGLRPPRAMPCSLLHRTGPRRRLSVVHADLAMLRAAAHRVDATTNDAVLVAVAGALRRVLAARGESVDTFAIAVPVSGHGRNDPGVGNMVSPLLVPVPASGEAGHRLATVAAEVRAGRPAATGPPPIALLGWLFRPLAALGGYHWYMNHQHRLHTLVSHVRGPGEPLTFDGSVIRSVIPVAVAEGGNMTVHFEVFSYAGTITITAVTDPDHFTDVDALTDGLHAELELITHGPTRARVQQPRRHD